MRRPAGSILMLLIWAAMATAQNNPTPSFVIERPTVIAFFFLVSEGELPKDPDANEALGDFQLYASKAGPRLIKAGIDFQIVAARKFKIKNGRDFQTFRTGKIAIGYYFVSPGKRPHVDYGVMSDDDILDAARKNLQISIPAE